MIEIMEMLENLLGCYLVVALILFCFWLWRFWQDRTTPKTHLKSWLVVLILPWFCPIVILLSIIELTEKLAKLKFSKKHALCNPSKGFNFVIKDLDDDKKLTRFAEEKAFFLETVWERHTSQSS
jgi:hypothetical protein